MDNDKKDKLELEEITKENKMVDSLELENRLIILEKDVAELKKFILEKFAEKPTPKLTFKDVLELSWIVILFLASGIGFYGIYKG